MGRYLLRRTLSAPKERVYDFFVDPVAFSRWFVVPGFTTPADRVRIDARPGAEIQAVMVSAAAAMQVPFVVGFGDLKPMQKVVLVGARNSSVEAELGFGLGLARRSAALVTQQEDLRILRR